MTAIPAAYAFCRRASFDWMSCTSTTISDRGVKQLGTLTTSIMSEMTEGKGKICLRLAKSLVRFRAWLIATPTPAEMQVDSASSANSSGCRISQLQRADRKTSIFNSFHSRRFSTSSLPPIILLALTFVPNLPSQQTGRP